MAAATNGGQPPFPVLGPHLNAASALMHAARVCPFTEPSVIHARHCQATPTDIGPKRQAQGRDSVSRPWADHVFTGYYAALVNSASTTSSSLPDEPPERDGPAPAPVVPPP